MIQPAKNNFQQSAQPMNNLVVDEFVTNNAQPQERQSYSSRS